MKLKIGRVEFEGTEKEFLTLMKQCPNLLNKMKNPSKDSTEKYDRYGRNTNLKESS